MTKKINELNLAYVKRFMKKKRGWIDNNAVAGLKNIAKGGGKIDRENIKALGHGDLYTKKEETVVEGLATNMVQKFKSNKSDIMAHAITSGMYHVGGLDFGADVASSIHHELKHLPTNLKIVGNKIKNALPKTVQKFVKETEMKEGTTHRRKLQDLLGKHNNASKIDSIPQMFHKMMATRVAAILNKDTEKSKVMKGLAAQELAKMKEDELIDPNVIINEDVLDEYINRPPTKGFHIVKHKDSGQHVMVKTKTVGGSQSIKFHPDSKYQHVGAFKSKKHAKNYMAKHLADKNEATMAAAGTGKKHNSSLGIQESVSFKPWSGPFMGKIASARTGNAHKIPMSPEDEKTMMDPNSTREQRLAVAGRKMAWATANAKKKISEAVKKGKSWNPPEVQAKAAKEKKEKKMFASGKKEIDRLKKAGK